MTNSTQTNQPTTCARCGEPIARNLHGGFTNFGAVPVAGHRAALCPDGIHPHRPA